MCDARASPFVDIVARGAGLEVLDIPERQNTTDPPPLIVRTHPKKGSCPKNWSTQMPWVKNAWCRDCWFSGGTHALLYRQERIGKVLDAVHRPGVDIHIDAAISGDTTLH